MSYPVSTIGRACFLSRLCILTVETARAIMMVVVVIAVNYFIGSSNLAFTLRLLMRVMRGVLMTAMEGLTFPW